MYICIYIYIYIYISIHTPRHKSRWTCRGGYKNSQKSSVLSCYTANLVEIWLLRNFTIRDKTRQKSMCAKGRGDEKFRRSHLKSYFTRQILYQSDFSEFLPCGTQRGRSHGVQRGGEMRIGSAAQRCGCVCVSVCVYVCVCACICV